MGVPRPFRLFLTLLALSALFALTSAQFGSALNPTEGTSFGQPLRDDALLLPLNGALAKDRLDGLLVLPRLLSRQQQLICATNHTVCGGTQFCCPDGNVCCSGGTCCGAGTYCTTVGNTQGCCKLGHICTVLVNDCTVAGQQRCPNENFCCATGETCSRDANNLPRCSSNSTSVSSSISITSITSIIPTPTSHSLSSHPSQSHSLPTSTSTTASRPTLCLLDSAQTRGSLKRRRQRSAHPALNKRRSWWFR